MASKREQVIRNAEKLVSRGKIEAGIKEYRKVLAENPNDASTLNRVGDLYARLSRLEDAVRLFTQIAEQYTEDGFHVKAIAIYKKIIKLDPTRLAVYESLAELYHKQGLLNEARTQYQVLADYYLKHDDRAAAINIYDKMTEIEPDNPAHHLKLAELYQQGQLWDQALRSYRTIAELLLDHGKVEEAARVYQRGIELRSEDLDFVTDAVVGLRDSGNEAAARRLLAAAVERNPEAQRVVALLGLSEPEPEAAPPPELSDAEPEAEVTGWSEPEPSTPWGSEEGAGMPSLGWGAGEPSPSRLPELEEGGDFVLDLEAEPSSIVEPPPDMDRPGSAFETESRASGEEEDMGLEPPVLELDLPEVAEPCDAGDVPPEPGEADEPLPQTPEIEGFEMEIELDAPEAIEWGIEEPVAGSQAERPADIVSPPLRPFVTPPEPRPPIPEPPLPRVQDLIAEAEVFAKYGLEEKARERLGEVLKREPERVEAHQLLLELHLSAGDHGKAQTVAARIFELASAAGQREAWDAAHRKLERAGITLPGGPPSEMPPAAHEDRVSKLLESLGGQTAKSRPRHQDQSIDRALEDLAAEVLNKPRRLEPSSPPTGSDPATSVAPAAQRPEPLEPASEAPLREGPFEHPGADPSELEVPASPPALGPPPPASSLDELDLDQELPGIMLPEERRPEPVLDDTGMDWLTEAAETETSAGEERLFDDEEEFFDLAAELEEELGQEETRRADDLLGQAEEPTLAEIVEGFKRGVAESLSAEDYDTHYNLGIAYREMGLLDEAIGEFQVAAKDPAHLVDCCSMLGVCFLEKGLPELAVKWYQRGLAAPDVAEETTLSMLYDMGNVYMAMGDKDSARKTFVELYGMSSHFRDVVAKLEELEH